MHIMTPFRFWTDNPIYAKEISEQFDSIVIVSHDATSPQFPAYLKDFSDILKAYKISDEAFEETETFIVPNIPKFSTIKKMVYSPTGPLVRDYDDVRRFADASVKGIKRILKAGGRNPLLVVIYEPHPKFYFAELVALLGAAQAIYVPLEIRESVPAKHAKVGVLGFYSAATSPDLRRVMSAVETGRVLCRDIGGSDPERMAPPNVALYVQEMFANTCIDVQVIQDESILQRDYPLLAAVNRAARGIERHRARLIYLSYVPEGPYDTTVVLVGKGVTYDTGGADVKAGGVMAGMHRDKCGAAAVAGFFQTVAALKPERVKILGAMCMVRNSIGPDGYVADEIITSKAGARVRVGNTDAEGRMAMADALYHLKEQVVEEKNAYLFTIATLTGHAVLACGEGYSIVLENGPAKADKVGETLQKAGEEIGDMFEISTVKREDYEFHKGKSEYEDLLQCNNQPSSRTSRGHQSPAAFLIMSSGLDKHGNNSSKPLKYCHIDIAGSSGPFPGIPSGAPIPALTRRFLLN